MAYEPEFVFVVWGRWLDNSGTPELIAASMQREHADGLCELIEKTQPAMTVEVKEVRIARVELCTRYVREPST